MVDTKAEAQTPVHRILQPEHQHHGHAQIGGDDDDDDDDDDWLGSREAR